MQITGIGLAYLGAANFRKVWFAFFFLLFMIPIPSVIYYQATLPMQLLSTQATTFLLQVSRHAGGPPGEYHSSCPATRSK